MTVRVSKPEFDLKKKLTELDYSRVPYEKMPAGSVIQSVIRSTRTQSTTTSTSWSGTDVYASISPKFANSRILILVSGGMNGNAGGTANNNQYTVGCFSIWRSVGGGDYAAVDDVSQGQQRYHLDAHDYIPLSINFLDVSAHSLDEISYKVYFKRAHGTNSSVNTNRDGNNSTQMVLLEVKQ